MAIILAKKNNQYNIQRRYFYIDDESDLEALESEWDCGIGDIAELPNGTIYCRHSDGYDGDLWEKRSSGSSPSPALTPTPTPTPSSDILYVNAVYDDQAFITSLDKTASEIMEAAPMVVMVRSYDDNVLAKYPIVRYGESSAVSGYKFIFGLEHEDSFNNVFYAENTSDYPTDQSPVIAT